MPNPRIALTATGLTALAVATVLALVATSAAEADHAPIRAHALTTPGHNQFTDDVALQVRDRPEGRPTTVVNLRDASNIAVGQFTIQPGTWFPWHTHPGAGLVALAQGDLVFIYADDCVERRYHEGEAFVDPGTVHTAYDPSSTDVTVAIATFLGVDAGAPLAAAVDADTASALNAACGTHAPVPASTAHDH
jgi:quercetin dioxygenase-like cupin family protein